MDKIIALIFLVFFYSCRENTVQETTIKGSINTDTTVSKTFTLVDTLHAQPLHNWQLLDTANRENIYEDIVPDFLKNFAWKNGFPCPDTVTGCAACGYCAYIKLSNDWSYFAYERQETKHYCQLRIFARTRSGIIPVDTLYGTVISALPIKGNLVYQITLLEAYWEYERPMNVEFYQFEKGKFVLKDTIRGMW